MVVIRWLEGKGQILVFRSEGENTHNSMSSERRLVEVARRGDILVFRFSGDTRHNSMARKLICIIIEHKKLRGDYRKNSYYE